MSTTLNSNLGNCPICGSDIGTDHVIIEYETNGRPAAFAECPTCYDIVTPE